ncbi:MAG: hypothetical protein QXH44_05275 [Pyrobaculum sp.]
MEKYLKAYLRGFEYARSPEGREFVLHPPPVHADDAIASSAFALGRAAEVKRLPLDQAKAAAERGAVLADYGAEIIEEVPDAAVFDHHIFQRGVVRPPGVPIATADIAFYIPKVAPIITEFAKSYIREVAEIDNGTFVKRHAEFSHMFATSVAFEYADVAMLSAIGNKLFRMTHSEYRSASLNSFIAGVREVVKSNIDLFRVNMPKDLLVQNAVGAILTHNYRQLGQLVLGGSVRSNTVYEISPIDAAVAKALPPQLQEKYGRAAAEKALKMLTALKEAKVVAVEYVNKNNAVVTTKAVFIPTPVPQSLAEIVLEEQKLKLAVAPSPRGGFIAYGTMAAQVASGIKIGGAVYAVSALKIHSAGIKIF